MSEISTLEFDLIFIANTHYNTLKEVLALGIPLDKIRIASRQLMDKCVDHNIKFVLSADFTQKSYPYLTEPHDRTIEIDGNIVAFSDDGFKIATVQIIAEEIRLRKVDGEIAELGVYKGDFAQYLNMEFPDRPLNLFDTFEGFDRDDEQNDLDSNLVSDRVIRDTSFLDTSVDLVLSKMKHPEQVRIFKGYFPDTIPSEEKRFALVSLDTDIYPPMLAGLEYFYPRLSEGGFIMAHDYNSANFFDSVHKAVEEFERRHGHIAKIPIADEMGTLVITK